MNTSITPKKMMSGVKNNNQNKWLSAIIINNEKNITEENKTNIMEK